VTAMSATSETEGARMGGVTLERDDEDRKGPLKEKKKFDLGYAVSNF